MSHCLRLVILDISELYLHFRERNEQDTIALASVSLLILCPSLLELSFTTILTIHLIFMSSDRRRTETDDSVDHTIGGQRLRLRQPKHKILDRIHYTEPEGHTEADRERTRKRTRKGSQRVLL